MLLRSVRLHFASGALTELPQRILVGKWGRNESVNGDYVINETTAHELPANLRRVNYDTVALDFDHNTVKGSPAYKAEQEPRRVAAHGTLQVVAGEGLYFIPQTWTPEGKAAVHGGHFPDISPAILTNAAGEVVFVDSVALCRQGATEGLRLDLHSAGLGTLSPVSKNMNPDTALLLSLLGLPETATTEEKQAAAKALAAKIDQANTTATNAAQVAEATKAELKTMSADFAKLRDQLSGDEKTRLINEAIAAGKLVTNSVQKLPLEHLKAVLAELPEGAVPMDRRTPAAIQTHASSMVLTADKAAEAAVFKQLGLSPDA